MPVRGTSPTQVKHGDLAAITAKKLEADHASELRAREEELATSLRLEAEASDEVIDLTEQDLPEIEEPVEVGDDREVFEVRINAEIQDMTLGAGKIYNFTEGGKYKVTRHMRDHLEERGYIWH